MSFDDENHAHRAEVTEQGIPLEVRDLASRVASPGFGWMRFYSRLAGFLQMFYAVIVGLLACVTWSDFVHDVVHYGEPIGKGIGPRYPRLDDFFGSTICSLLLFTGFIGGYGLLRLRPWARRWEIAYLGAVAVLVAVLVVAMLSRAIRRTGEFDELTILLLIAMIIAMPYLPFLDTRWPGVISPPPCKSSSKPVVDDLF